MDFSSVIRQVAGFVIVSNFAINGAVGAEDKAGLVTVNAASSVAAGTAAAGDQKTSAVTLEKLLSDANALISAGKPADAFKILEPHDFEYSGNVGFDYLLGIAALDSNQPDKATLAFERVLAVDPNFAGARLDMARAYFQLGDLPRAKTEFDAVMKQDPPEAARTTIQKYLNSIASSERAKKTHISGYAEGTFGRDTNVNNSTSQSQIAVPAFGNLVFTLSPTNLKTPDSYYTAAAGGEVSHNEGGKLGVYAGADLRKRGNQSLTSFDSSSVDTRGGFMWDAGDNVFRVGGTFSQFSLAHMVNRNAYGLTGDWRHSFSPSNQLNLFGQYGLNRFADSAMQSNNFNQRVIGTGFLHILGDGKTALFSSLNLADEKAAGRADGNKTGYGLRVGGQTSLRESFDVFANVGYQSGRYDKDNAAFLTSRSDKLYDFSLGGNWHRDKNWTVRSQLSYSNNKSSISIYSFDRIDASITLRRDFR